MRVAVTGGTGFVGRHLVASLARRGRDVLVLTRGPSAAPPEPRGADAGRVERLSWTPGARGPWVDSVATCARAAGVRVAHPGIGIVLGRDGGALAKLLPAFRAFVGGPLGDGTQWFSWVHVDDRVRALVFALDSEIDGAFNATAPEPVTMNELATTLGAVLGRPSFLRVPAFAVRAMVGDGARALLTGQRAVPRALERAGFAFDHPRLKRALERLLAPGGGAAV